MCDIKALVNKVADEIIKNKDLLTQLDQEIGDGDHGINMARGFENVKIKINQMNDSAPVSEYLKQIAMTLIASVGGASGPLYGTAFLRASQNYKNESNLEDFKNAFESAIKGIKERGKATFGEKTMLDTLIPAFDTLCESMDAKKSQKECLDEMLISALKGVEHTRTIIATKGRASYLGERSLGHQDPGATSCGIILKAGIDFINGENNQ